MELKDKYDFTCAKCGHPMQFAPSISMQMGINTGHATCSKCNTFLHLEIDMHKQVGISILWDEHLELLKQNKELKRL